MTKKHAFAILVISSFFVMLIVRAFFIPTNNATYKDLEFLKLESSKLIATSKVFGKWERSRLLYKANAVLLGYTYTYKNFNNSTLEVDEVLKSIYEQGWFFVDTKEQNRKNIPFFKITEFCKGKYSLGVSQSHEQLRLTLTVFSFQYENCKSNG